ncbi:hypothetical protein HELRODRAFT_182715 [Helobdella robusta]|uniref:Uncharacterized protein n=1 Tax=Helobdella robusta TaxID=6412 RepID=T1FIM8_HELRO|nr:hypothetical protein HELRODRAFT_182715 [Helobdella robusta]ESN90218.1 hypothetical protein HELRODRAFT_182715 [Helobdella robusta]
MPHRFSCKVKEHQVFSNFLECSSDDVKAVILKAPPTTCMLDPIPTSLFNKHIELILPYLTDLINMCLKTGSYPMIFKKAIVSPLLKQPSSDTNELKSFRPVSNLSFIAKIVERVRSSMNFENRWVLRSALNFASDREVVREVASVREQDMEIYEKRKGHEQLDEQS